MDIKSFKIVVSKQMRRFFFYTLVDYLESLSDADGQQYLTVEVVDKEKYLGDYIIRRWQRPGLYNTIKYKKIAFIDKIGKFGGVLFRTSENEFTYNGARSVSISLNPIPSKTCSIVI